MPAGEDFRKYLDPEFDPNVLRVVDLKRILDEYDVAYVSKTRKANLVSLFEKEIIPRLQAKQMLVERKEKTKKPLISESPIKEPSVKPGVKKSSGKKPLVKRDQYRNQTRKSPTKESKLVLQRLIESQRSPSKLSTQAQRKVDGLPKSTHKSTFEASIPAKRHIENTKEDEEGNTAIYQEYSKILRRTTNRKDDFSSSPVSPSKSTINQESPIKTPSKPPVKRSRASDLFPRNGEIKFEEDVGPKEETVDEKEVENPSKSNTTEHQLDSSSNGSMIYRPVDGSSYVTALDETKYNKPADNWVLPKDEQLSMVVPILPSSTPMVQKVRHKKRKSKTGSKVTTELLKEDVNVDAVRGPTKKIERASHSKPEELEEEASTLSSLIHTPEMSSDGDDETVLKKLQAEFDSETTRVEEESKRALKTVNESVSISSYVPSQIIYRMIAGWLLLLLGFLAFTTYREERIVVGFCGHEIYNPLFRFDRRTHPTLAEYAGAVEEALKLDCIPCPEHAICFAYSELHCKQDYTIHKPWRSGFGLIPTFNTCVLDSEKVRKIDRIVKSTCDTLAKRNADYKCGTGTDEQVGLSYETIQNYLVHKLDMEPELQSGEFEYLWNKAMSTMKEKPELVFKDEYLRSNSLAKLSLKCKLKRVFVDILIRLKYWLLGLTVIGGIIGYIYARVERYHSEKSLVGNLTAKALQKLQDQSLAYRHKEVEHRYIGKIQLRDFYLSDPSMAQKKRLEVWDKVSRVVEKNSNVNAYSLEVNGEIMKVWEWASDI
ncbi:DEKNAAC104568 [Brettanomyces naardenensis]|uniref:DEKNAAC104568 n=1 Tax=Brettanomyces naardenensis TaxID=13370 RepID=A0A448YRC8_BRENA|nr:DEKNAAC104568 [Brettanomyces naardenensis]